jgi:small subunit ribosomal protein S16
MAVRVRLRRIGKNPSKKPHFRVSVFEETRGRDSRVIEELGYYNPINQAFDVKVTRIEYWASKGAQLSDTVRDILKKSKKKVAKAE